MKIIALLKAHDELTFKEIYSFFKNEMTKEELRGELEKLELAEKIESYISDKDEITYCLEEK